MEYTVLITVLALYMLPGIIALIYEKQNKVAICVFNLLLGWTFLGWIAALIWSLLRDARPQPLPSATPFPVGHLIVGADGVEYWHKGSNVWIPVKPSKQSVEP